MPALTFTHSLTHSLSENPDASYTHNADEQGNVARKNDCEDEGKNLSLHYEISLTLQG